MIIEVLFWAQNNYALLLGIVTVSSVALLCLTVFLTPWLVTRLPEDYFIRAPSRELDSSGWRSFRKVLRNIAGVTIIAAGLVMLVIPGPGLITVVVGLTLCDFSTKRTLLRKLLSQPPILRSLNWMRNRANKPPFRTA